MKTQLAKTYAILTSVCASLVAAAAVVLVVATPVTATPQFGKETGQTCAACHIKATGGGALTPLGEQFKANGNKMPGK